MIETDEWYITGAHLWV